MTARFSALVAGVALALAASACSLVAGLGKYERVDCLDDCGDAGPDGNDGAVTDDSSPADGAGDTSTCVPDCAPGSTCVASPGGYTCVQSCKTALDCVTGTASDAGDGGDAGDAGSKGAAVACCNERCVDTSTDGNNCGACGATCGTQGCCNSVCGDIGTLPTSCGACNSVCSSNNIPAPTCSSLGSCNGACGGTFADCNNNKLVDGCEVDLGQDPSHCGGCPNVCSTNHVPTTACAGGSCSGTCQANWADCNTNKLFDGCEIDITTTAAHCGACANNCSSNHITTPTCAAGSCNGTCDPGYMDCANGKLADGCETNTNTDSLHCGACGTVCGANTRCVAATCTPWYVESTSPQAFVDACGLGGHTTDLGGAVDDDIITPNRALPFAFSFYGAAVTTYWFSTNGVFGFGSNATASPASLSCLPNGSDLPPAIYPFAADMVTTTGICTAVTGAAPNRKFVVTWSNANMYSGTIGGPDPATSISISMFLSETSGIIDFTYSNVSGTDTDGANAVVGLEDATATSSRQHSCDVAASITAATKLRYVP